MVDSPGRGGRSACDSRPQVNGFRSPLCQAVPVRFPPIYCRLSLTWRRSQYAVSQQGIRPEIERFCATAFGGIEDTSFGVGAKNAALPSHLCTLGISLGHRTSKTARPSACINLFLDRACSPSPPLNAAHCRCLWLISTGS